MDSKFIHRYRDLLIVIVLLLTPLLFYISNSKNVRDHNMLDRAVLWISAPIQWAVVGTLTGVANTWSRYIDLVDAAADNVKLREENARLRGDAVQVLEYQLENERLRRLLGLRRRADDVDLLVAQVIATSPTPLFRSLRIDRGERDGVRLGAAVVNYEGVVGRVAAIGAHWADVMLVVDPNNSIDVLVQRTRTRARARGTGRDDALAIGLQYLARTADVEPGDRLVTSGIGSVFPKGLPIGRVITVERRSFGLYQHAEAEPAVDFYRIEEVLVVRGRRQGNVSEIESDEMAPTPNAPSEEPPPAAAPSGAQDVSTGAP